MNKQHLRRKQRILKLPLPLSQWCIPFKILSTIIFNRVGMILLMSLAGCKSSTTEPPLTEPEKQCRVFRKNLYLVYKKLIEVRKLPNHRKLFVYREVAKLMNPATGFYIKGCSLCVRSNNYLHEKRVQFVRHCIKNAQRSYISLNRLAERVENVELNSKNKRLPLQNINSSLVPPRTRKSSQIFNKKFIRKLSYAHENSANLFSDAISYIYQHVRFTKAEKRNQRSLLQHYRKKRK